MAQVSRPLLITLAATVVLFAFWFVSLRPDPVTVDAAAPPAPVGAPPVAAPPVATPPSSRASADAASPAATARVPAPVRAAADSSSGGPRDAAVMRDIRSGKVVVMLFWNARGADDRATRAAVGGLDRHRGKVAVHVVGVSRVVDYPSITQNVTISQSPTTVVIGRDRRARVIVGLSEPHELSQAVRDALARR